MPTTTDKKNKKVHHALDTHAIIRACLPDEWTVVQPAAGHIEIGRADNLAGIVHYDPTTTWRCHPIDAEGTPLSKRWVSPSAAAEAVARAALKAEAAHA